jgi:predicted HicB family RNase H-like nuclease
MKTKPKESMKQLSAKVPEEVHRALKVRAAEEGKSVAVIVEGLIREYLVKGESHA